MWGSTFNIPKTTCDEIFVFFDFLYLVTQQRLEGNVNPIRTRIDPLAGELHTFACVCDGPKVAHRVGKNRKRMNKRIKKAATNDYYWLIDWQVSTTDCLFTVLSAK